MKCRSVRTLLLLTSWLLVGSGHWVAAQQNAPAAVAKGARDRPTVDEDDEYFALFRLLADTIDEVERNYVRPIERREIFEAAVKGILSELDPYSDYLSPDQYGDFRDDVENEFAGLGLRVARRDERLMVISPLAGTPAYRSGIQAGEMITAIDGEATREMSLAEAVRRMKGPRGSTTKLSIMRRGRSRPLIIPITRDRIEVETVLGFTRSPQQQWVFVFDEADDIAYIRLTAFARDTPSDLRQVLQRLQAEQIRGLVLDLRFNPGGLLPSAIEVADMFIDDGLIVAVEGRNTRRREWRAKKSTTVTRVPLVVLVHRYTASASEIVAACLQDHGRAKIVGERTWGKASVQNVVELEGGQSALKLTTSSYRRPSGRNIHRFPQMDEDDQWGVRPDPEWHVAVSAAEIAQVFSHRQQRDVIPPANDGEAVDLRPAAAPSLLVGDRQLQRALDSFNRVTRPGDAP